MPMKLNLGVSHKVGLPDYGSVGASCNLGLELDSDLLDRDLDAFLRGSAGPTSPPTGPCTPSWPGSGGPMATPARDNTRGRWRPRAG